MTDTVVSLCVECNRDSTSRVWLEIHLKNVVYRLSCHVVVPAASLSLAMRTLKAHSVVSKFFNKQAVWSQPSIIRCSRNSTRLRVSSMEPPVRPPEAWLLLYYIGLHDCHAWLRTCAWPYVNITVWIKLCMCIRVLDTWSLFGHAVLATSKYIDSLKRSRSTLLP